MSRVRLSTEDLPDCRPPNSRAQPLSDALRTRVSHRSSLPITGSDALGWPAGVARTALRRRATSSTTFHIVRTHRPGRYDATP